MWFEFELGPEVVLEEAVEAMTEEGPSAFQGTFATSCFVEDLHLLVRADSYLGEAG